MRSVTNSTYVKLLSVTVAITMLAAQPIKADESHTEKAGKELGSSVRAEAKKEVFPEKYDELLKTLEKEIELKAVSADGVKENNKKFKIGGESKIVADQIKTLKEYREKLKGCSTDSEKKTAELLDSYISSLLLSLGSKDATSTDLSNGILPAIKWALGAGAKATPTVSEKVINTFTLQLRSILEAKAKKHEKSKDTFEAEDKKAIEALNKLAGALWDSKEEGKFRESIFDAEKAKSDEKTKSIVESADKAKASLEKSEEACKLVKASDSSSDSEGSSGSSSSSNSGGSPSGSVSDSAGPEAATSNPAVADTTPNTGTQGSGNPGTGTGTPVGTGATGNTFDPSAAGQLSDVQNALRSLQDALLRQQLENERLRDEQDRGDDDLNRALQLARQLQPDGNRSANRENTEGSPSISPQIPSGSSGGGGSPGVPPAQPPMQPPPMIPPSAYMPPPTPPMPSSGLGEPSKWNQEPIRPTPPPTDTVDPKTAGLLEVLKMQQQLLLQSQQAATQRGGAPNVYNNSSRLTAYGPAGGSYTRTTTRTGSRMNGTASSSSQATMSANSRARTQAPK